MDTYLPNFSKFCVTLKKAKQTVLYGLTRGVVRHLLCTEEELGFPVCAPRLLLRADVVLRAVDVTVVSGSVL